MIARKKIIGIICGVLVLCGLSGCNNSSKDSVQKKTDNVEETVGNQITSKAVAKENDAEQQDPDAKYLEIPHNELVSKYTSQDKTIAYIKASYAIDVDDYTELTNYADYCFVGKVNDVINVQMDSPLQQEANTSGSPYTVYDVTVEENIKNEIKPGSRIKVLKKGGLLEDQETFEVMEGDNIPEVGKYYVFSALVQQDQTLMASGKNSTIECEKGLKDVAVDKMDQAVTAGNQKERKQRKAFSLDLEKVKIK